MRAKEKGDKSSFEFLIDFLTLASLRQNTREGTNVTGGNVLGIPDHTFHLLGVVFIILIMMILFLGAALGGLLLLT